MGFESPCLVCLFFFINDIFSRLLFLHSTIYALPFFIIMISAGGKKAFLVLMYAETALEADGITSVSVHSCQVVYEN